MHIPDLEIRHGRTAIGWLHPDHEFPQGDVPVEFISKLQQFSRLWGKSVGALGWGVACGFHECEFCDKVRASGTFGVPFGGRLYYAPEMIAHYVEHHRYQPPAEFISAVLASPLPGTQEYAAAAAPFAIWYDRAPTGPQP
jgi:hypothetical protein